MMFPHPDTFKDMSKEERKEKTEKQMAAHKTALPEKMRL